MHSDYVMMPGNPNCTKNGHRVTHASCPWRETTHDICKVNSYRFACFEKLNSADTRAPLKTVLKWTRLCKRIGVTSRALRLLSMSSIRLILSSWVAVSWCSIGASCQSLSPPTYQDMIAPKPDLQTDPSSNLLLTGTA